MKVHPSPSTKSVPLLQSGYGFCWLNGSKRCQILHRAIPMHEKVLVGSFCMDAWYICPEWLDSLSSQLYGRRPIYSLSSVIREILNTIFLKYSHDGVSKWQMSWISIRHVPDCVQYDQVKHYQVPAEKQGRCKVCKKNSRRMCVRCKVNLHNDFFEFFHNY